MDSKPKHDPYDPLVKLTPYQQQTLAAFVKEYLALLAQGRKPFTNGELPKFWDRKEG
jgi:hypothetical protein